MNNGWQKDKEFKEEIGSFIIAFSEFEFGLVSLCSMTEFDLRQNDKYIIKYLGYTFEKKISHLTDFISENLHELTPNWDKIKKEIMPINKERRFLVHGHMNYGLPNEHITTHIKEKDNITTKRQKLEEIRSNTNKIHNLISGENGIRGEFEILFTKTRINKWNKLVNDESKIIYRINSEILSD